jgi:hypothetical protein
MAKVRSKKKKDGREAVVIEVAGTKLVTTLKEADELHRDLKDFRRKRTATHGQHSLLGKVCPVCARMGKTTPINDRAETCYEHRRRN